MYKRDLIKDQIEQMGKVLRQILGKAFNLRLEPDIESVIEEVRKELIEQLDFDLSILDTSSLDELQTQLQSLNLVPQHLELLFDACKNFVDAFIEKNCPIEAGLYLTRAEILSKILDTQTQSFSMARNNALSSMKIALKALNDED